MSTEESDYWAAVATVIKMEMAAAGMSQAKLGASAGVGREAMSNYLRGNRDMPFSVLVKVAAALGLSPRGLFELAEARLQQGK
ncbi:helix-turn-helix domain-containing protein [Arthrobacter sp. MA-N2]|uniref:helix-turn-helix domain-containing protein n=1 Tax=Arthrobacter sp. MA-N2 TaxID=1101188 RepID=UPI0004B816A4|nr:helix-turn-helix transcriptional regulator [Arthrobacter sp. MA-N2]